MSAYQIEGQVTLGCLTKVVKDDGSFHMVFVSREGGVGCDCTGYQYRGTCVHSKLVAEKVVRPGRVHRVAAEPIIREVAKWFQPVLLWSELAGSYRRGKPDLKDVDVVAIGDAHAVAATAKEKGCEMGPCGRTIVRFTYKGLKFDFLFVDDQDCLGAALLYRTGPAELNIRMRGEAKRRGWKLNEKGLFNVERTKVAGETERSVFEALGFRYVEPKFR